MSLVAFAADQGFGHWSRVRSYLTLPPLRDNSVMIAPVVPASLSWREVNTVGYVDPGDRFILGDNGGVTRIVKFNAAVNFKAGLTQYYALPWTITLATHGSTFVIDAHNEPELLLAGELWEECRGIVKAAHDGGLRRTVFTLETQRFNVLPLRYRRAFEKCDLILVPYEPAFFRQCVPLEPFEDFKSKMMFFGNAINSNTVRLLRKPKDEARTSLHLPMQKTVIFCAYGRGEGALDVVSTVLRVGEKLTAENKDFLFAVSDPTGAFRKACPPRGWLQFIELDSEKALTTLAACDCTIQGLGTNTLLETLVAGKPMVAISLDRPYEEQASKGRGVASLGLGTHLPLKAVNAQTIKDALLRTLEEGSTSQRSKALSTALGDLKGAERIAAELSRTI